MLTVCLIRVRRLWHPSKTRLDFPPLFLAILSFTPRWHQVPSVQLCVWYKMGIQQAHQKQTRTQISGAGRRDKMGGRHHPWEVSLNCCVVVFLEWGWRTGEKTGIRWEEGCVNCLWGGKPSTASVLSYTYKGVSHWQNKTKTTSPMSFTLFLFNNYWSCGMTAHFSSLKNICGRADKINKYIVS